MASNVAIWLKNLCLELVICLKDALQRTQEGAPSRDSISLDMLDVWVRQPFKHLQDSSKENPSVLGEGRHSQISMYFI